MSANKDKLPSLLFLDDFLRTKFNRKLITFDDV